MEAAATAAVAKKNHTTTTTTTTTSSGDGGGGDVFLSSSTAAAAEAEAAADAILFSNHHHSNNGDSSSSPPSGRKNSRSEQIKRLRSYYSCGNTGNSNTDGNSNSNSSNFYQNQITVERLLQNNTVVSSSSSAVSRSSTSTTEEHEHKDDDDDDDDDREWVRAVIRQFGAGPCWAAAVATLHALCHQREEEEHPNHLQRGGSRPQPPRQPQPTWAVAAPELCLHITLQLLRVLLLELPNSGNENETLLQQEGNNNPNLLFWLSSGSDDANTSTNIQQQQQQQEQQSKRRRMLMLLPDDEATLTGILNLPNWVAQACGCTHQTAVPSLFTESHFYRRLLRAALTSLLLLPPRNNEEEESLENDDGPQQQQQQRRDRLLLSLLERLVRRRGGRDAAAALQQYFGDHCCVCWNDQQQQQQQQQHSNKATAAAVNSRRRHLQSILRRLPPRAAALLCRALLRLDTRNSGNDPPTPRRDDDDGAASWLDCIGGPLLQRHGAFACRWIVLLEPPPPQRQQLRLPVALAQLLHRVGRAVVEEEEEPKDDRENSSDDDDDDDDDSSSSSSDDDDDDGATWSPKTPIPSHDLLLYRNLCRVAAAWSQAVFVRRTAAAVQRRASLFLVAGLQLLTPPLDPARALGRRLLPGIAERLGATAPEIRADGMRVAQQLAQLLGQELQFDELANENGSSSGDDDYTVAFAAPREKTNDNNRTASPTLMATTTTTTEASKKGALLGKLKRAKKIRQTDPDAAYESSDSSDTEDDNKNNIDTADDEASARSAYSDDSEWDGNDGNIQQFAPYSLEDDREDLRETPLPLYLNECLDYLRSSPQDDERAASRHETCLRALPRLVRARPADLTDLGPELARSVLRLENFFAVADYNELVAGALQAFLVQDPLVVGPHLIEELFQDGSLRDREVVLLALESGARELSGQKMVDAQQQRENTLMETRILQKLEDSSPRVSGKRGLVQRSISESKELPPPIAESEESRTRRWGRGKHRNVAPTVQNRFGGDVAPVWFYALVGNFMNHKDDEAMWGGTIGAILLSRLFITLGIVVECTGPYSLGVDLLAKDLFELVWAFRDAEIPSVRAAALYAASRTLPLLREEVLVGLLLDGSPSDSLMYSLHYMTENDPDDDCRTLAGIMYKSAASASQGIIENAPGLLM